MQCSVWTDSCGYAASELERVKVGGWLEPQCYLVSWLVNVACLLWVMLGCVCRELLSYIVNKSDCAGVMRRDVMWCDVICVM